MAKFLVPAQLEAEFGNDARFAGREVEIAASAAAAVRRLADATADEVYIGAASEPLDRASYEAFTRSAGSFLRPVVAVAPSAYAIWANDLAVAQGLDPATISDAPIEALFDEEVRGSLRRALDKCTANRQVVRTIVFQNKVSRELQLVPLGDSRHPLTLVSFGEKDLAGAFSGRMERLAALGPHLYPEDAEALVSLPHDERVALLKNLIEKTVKEVFEYDDFVVRTLDQKTGALDAIMARSESGGIVSKRPYHASTVGNSVAGWVAATGKPYLVEDASTDPIWIQDLAGAQSAVVVPLKIGEKVMGTFAIEKKEEHAYDRYDLILALLFGGYIVAVLEIADLVGLGQRVLVDKVADSVVQEASGLFQSIQDSVEELRRHNIGDNIAVTSRLESIRASVAGIREAILKGAKKIGAGVTAPPMPGDQILAGKTVLIADDEPSILQSLGDILKGSGCKVEVARDGLEAVQMGTSTMYDIVISDIKMPKMSGYEVYSSIKSKFPRTGVILMTAYGYDPTHSIVRARQEGLEAVLYKPFRAETLKKSLKQALEKKVVAQ